MPLRRTSSRKLPTAPWRVFAAGLAALVLGLTLAGASPDLHAWIHGEADIHAHAACAHHGKKASTPDAGHDDHRCAVVMFAQGFDLPVDASFAVLPFERISVVVTDAETLFLAQPRYLRQPERGPPST